MKKVFYASIFSVFLTASTFQNSFALSFDKALKQVDSSSVEGLNKDISAKVDEKLDKVIKKYEGQLDGEVKKYQGQIEAEQKKIQDIIAETEESINKIRDIKNNIFHYINIVKTIIAILGSGMLALLFVVWRVWRNVVGMKNLIQNVTNYKDFDKRLKQLEAEIKALRT